MGAQAVIGGSNFVFVKEDVSLSVNTSKTDEIGVVHLQEWVVERGTFIKPAALSDPAVGQFVVSVKRVLFDDTGPHQICVNLSRDLSMDAFHCEFGLGSAGLDCPRYIQ